MFWIFSHFSFVPPFVNFSKKLGRSLLKRSTTNNELWRWAELTVCPTKPKLRCTVARRITTILARSANIRWMSQRPETLISHYFNTKAGNISQSETDKPTKKYEKWTSSDHRINGLPTKPKLRCALNLSFVVLIYKLTLGISYGLQRAHFYFWSACQFLIALCYLLSY